MSPILVAALVMVAVALAVAGLGMLLLRDKSRLEQALLPYEPKAVADLDDLHREVTLVESKFLQRAVESTGRIATERGLMQIIEKKLDQADLPLRGSEALFVYLAA